MLRQLVNELTVQVEVDAQSPLLIKDGRYVKAEWAEAGSALAKKIPDSVFISSSPKEELRVALTALPGIDLIRKLMFYVPGSSIRGAWRSHLEQVLRSLDPERPKVCDPLLTKTDQVPNPGIFQGCSTVLVTESQPRPPMAYKGSCPVCRLFGSTAQASRISFSDGKVIAGDPGIVDNVAISRFTGAVVSPFKSLALFGARFTLTLRLENFELWQAGLLAWLFDDLAAGRVPLGSGKNKGLGQITAHATEIEIAFYGGTDRLSDGKLRGLGEIFGDKELKYYGIRKTTPLDVAVVPKPGLPWRHAKSVSDPTAFWTSLKECFNQNVWSDLPSLENRETRARA